MPHFSFRFSTLPSLSMLGITLLGLPAPDAVAGTIPNDLQLTQVVDGLSSPVAVKDPGDGSGRLFIVEQGGNIRIWNGSGLLPTPFLSASNLTSLQTSGFEQGLLGLAFHPNFTSNGYVYVNYTRGSGAGETAVTRFQVSTGNSNVADPMSATDIVVIDQDFSNHNGGDIHFGPDGYLYIGMGDGGSGGDPNNRAQDLGELLGKMLRIDVDGSPAPGDELCGLVQNYGIPESNPFVDSAGACDEIWAYGLRNPWRFSFDRSSGDLIIGDVGQNAWEEIDFQPAGSAGGENYGWRTMEGTHCFNPSSGCNTAGLVLPILEYSHGGGHCSVTGGYRYAISSIPGLQGTYFYADYCSNTIWMADETAPGVWSAQTWTDHGVWNITSFGEDATGNLYVVAAGPGALYRIISPSSEAIFSDGFESGDITAWQ